MVEQSGTFELIFSMTLANKGCNLGRLSILV